MPPAKRVTQDDSSTSSKQAPPVNNVNGRGKRTIINSAVNNASASKDRDAGSDEGDGSLSQGSGTGLAWNLEDLELLQTYRAAHKMDSPSAFSSPLNQCLLTNPGIGRHSPTMARKRAQRKIAREQLALVVRKNFNSAAVNEVNVMVDLLYKVRNQGKAGDRWRSIEC